MTPLLQITEELQVNAIALYLRWNLSLTPEKQPLGAQVFFDVFKQHVEREVGEFHIRSIQIFFGDTIYIDFQGGKATWGFQVFYDRDRGIYVLERVLPSSPPLRLSLVPIYLPAI